MKKILLFTIISVAVGSFLLPSKAYALNQTGDWQFSDNTNWQWNNASSTDTCGNTTQTTGGTAFSTFARDATGVISSRSNNATKSSTVVQRGNVFQTFIATSTGNVNYKGRFDFSSSIGGAGAFSSVAWARADIYNAANSTWVGLIGCSAFSAATATTTISNDQPIVLTGGTTYTIRLSTSLKSVNTTGTSNNIYMDKIIVSAPPVNVAVTAPVNTKNASLTWDVSTATTSANGLAAANGYSIYRGTTSGGETALASSTSNSYTDSSATGNTTYYYWITNEDTTGYASASSSEVSILTRPGAPGNPTYDTVTQTSMNVNWTAPTGGASTYKLERCITTTTTCTLVTGISGLTQAVSGLTANTSYDFAVIGTNATGDGVWSATTTQSTLRVPAIQFLEPGGDADFNVKKSDDTTTPGFWSGLSTPVPTLATDFTHGAHIKSIKYSPNQSSSVKSLTGVLSDSGGRISLYIYLVALPSSTNSIVTIQASDTNDLMQIKLTSGGVLRLYSNGVQIGTDGATLSTGIWYRLALSYTITSTTINRFELFKDGASTISVTNATLARTGAGYVTIGNVNIDTTLDFRSSDHYIDNGQGLDDPGNIWVTVKRPNANGTANEFTSQIGSSGSGYGSGHSPQVNERPLSKTNGWGVVGTGAILTEEYNIESASTGDIDLTGATIVGYMGFAAMRVNSGTATIQLRLNGVDSSKSISSLTNMSFATTTSSTYPAGTGTDIGVATDTSLSTYQLYETGVVVAYIPASPASTFLEVLYIGDDSWW